MSVSSQHKQYTAMLERWARCRDAAEGQDAIHAAGPAYLPMLSEQSKSEYDAYKTRASFYNATWRTISGLQGMIFRKPAIAVFPAVVEPMMADVSLAGEPLHMFALGVVEECLMVGRVGVFVDYPIVDLLHTTAADAALHRLRPTLKQYKAESIINWRTSVVRNATALSRVVLLEDVEVAKSEFESESAVQYRVLDLAPATNAAGVTQQVYRVRVFVIDPATKEDRQIGDDLLPLVKGEPLDFIPFYFIGVDSNSPEADAPPLIDLVDINLSHYRTNADYEHGCHFTGLPTPVVSGYTVDTANPAGAEKFEIGSTTAWVFPRPDAKAFFLEFTGQGLKSLEHNLDRKETQMAVLGARMLENKLNTGESGNSTAINLGGEQSTLASIAQAVSLGLQGALSTFAKFAGSAEPVKYSLNKDFFPNTMDPLRLTALVASWQNGAISYDTLFKDRRAHV